jgi:hypothetical protein
MWYTDFRVRQAGDRQVWLFCFWDKIVLDMRHWIRQVPQLHFAKMTMRVSGAEARLKLTFIDVAAGGSAHSSGLPGANTMAGAPPSNKRNHGVCRRSRLCGYSDAG